MYGGGQGNNSFADLMSMAKQNAEEGRRRAENSQMFPEASRPKRADPKQVRLKEGVAKFLAKRDEEDKKRRDMEKQKKEKLLELRHQDRKATNRVRKMLSMTKSANKSCVDDAKDCLNAAVAAQSQGDFQPDEDDYGYTSNYADAMHKKMMEKYKSIPIKPAFPQSRLAGPKPQSLQSRNATNNVVREPSPPPAPTPAKPERHRKPPPPDYRQLLLLAQEKSQQPLPVGKKDSDTPIDEFEFGRPMTAKEKKAYLVEKEFKDRIARRQEMGSDKNNNKPREERVETPPRKAKAPEPDTRRSEPAPTATSSSSLTSKHKKGGRVEQSQPNPPMEDRRPMPSERSFPPDPSRKKLIPEKSRRERERDLDSPKKMAKSSDREMPSSHGRPEYSSRPRPEHTSQARSGHPSQARSEYNSQARSEYNSQARPEHNSQARPGHPSQARSEYNSQARSGHPSQARSGHSSQTRPEYNSQARSGHSSQTRPEYNSQARPGYSSQARPEHNSQARSGHSSQSRPEYNTQARSGYPPQDRPNKANGHHPSPAPAHSRATERMPFGGSKQKQEKLMRKPRPASPPPRPAKMKPKYRPVIDSEDEYDSEMDDFIDDSGADMGNISAEISRIFNYDRRRYRLEESDDECMESSVAQQMREEQRSLRIGIQEDLEDIQREEAEKKMKKRRPRMF